MTATRSPWSALPPGPGVYLMIDRAGRTVYVGRASDLRSRVRSYWSSPDPYRPHLRGMTRRVARVDHVSCVSEHAAAFLERALIARHEPPYNRTYGVESEWWLRLSTDPAEPGLEPVREPSAAPGTTCFGPYLGGRAVRLAAAALSRLYPLSLAAETLDRAGRDLARSRGVTPVDRDALAARIAAVLRGEPAAVAECVAALEAQRDRAAGATLFERASELQETVRAVGWLTQPREPLSI